MTEKKAIYLYNPKTDAYDIGVDLTPWDVAFIRGDRDEMARIKAEALEKSRALWDAARREREEPDPFEPTDPPAPDPDYDPIQEKIDMENDLRHYF